MPASGMDGSQTSAPDTGNEKTKPFRLVDVRAPLRLFDFSLVVLAAFHDSQ